MQPNQHTTDGWRLFVQVKDRPVHYTSPPQRMFQVESDTLLFFLSFPEHGAWHQVGRWWEPANKAWELAANVRLIIHFYIVGFRLWWIRLIDTNGKFEKSIERVFYSYKAVLRE